MLSELLNELEKVLDQMRHERAGAGATLRLREDKGKVMENYAGRIFTHYCTLAMERSGEATANI